MELQTIRQKLQTLKASPPEPVAAPWGQSRLAAPSPDLAQVTTAIATLKQRSHQPPAAVAPSPTMQQLQQFETALAAVENLAQQQAATLHQLQTLGVNITLQSQPGISPEVDDIARFLEDCQIIEIPTVQRAPNGTLGLAYHSINFHQAEQDATSTAQKLRRRSSQLFQRPLPPSPDLNADGSYSEGADRGLLGEIGRLSAMVNRFLQRRSVGSASLAQPRRSQFTLLDGAIWCIGAAIARIILHQLFRLYPPLWTPVALGLIGGIIFSLYQAIFSPRPHPILGYRTLITILGLLLGGRFL